MTIVKNSKAKKVYFTLSVTALAVILASGILINCGERTSSELGTQVAAIEVSPDDTVDRFVEPDNVVDKFEVEISPNSWKSVSDTVVQGLTSALVGARHGLRH